MNPYLSFKDNCKAAFDQYQQVLGAKLVFAHTYGESPMAEHAPGGNKDAIMHATLQLPDGSLLMGADTPAEHYRPMQGFSLSINAANNEEGRRMFDALAEGGHITMPYEKTFWAEGFGMCVDRFGVPWMVNAEHSKPE